MFNDFVNADSIQDYTTIILLITIITELLKRLLSDLNINGLNAKIISFVVGFTISFIILILFKEMIINPQNIFLTLINSFLTTIAANGFYDTINKDN